jgi:hypothetical protein
MTRKWQLQQQVGFSPGDGGPAVKKCQGRIATSLSLFELAVDAGRCRWKTRKAGSRHDKSDGPSQFQSHAIAPQGGGESRDRGDVSDSVKVTVGTSRFYEHMTRKRQLQQQVGFSPGDGGPAVAKCQSSQ